MQEIIGQSLNIYARNRWELIGILCKKSFENRWKTMREIIGKSLEIYGKIHRNIVGHLCLISSEHRKKSMHGIVRKHGKSIPGIDGNSLEIYARNRWKII